MPLVCQSSCSPAPSVEWALFKPIDQGLHDILTCENTDMHKEHFPLNDRMSQKRNECLSRYITQSMHQRHMNMNQFLHHTHCTHFHRYPHCSHLRSHMYRSLHCVFLHSDMCDYSLKHTRTSKAMKNVVIAVTCHKLVSSRQWCTIASVLYRIVTSLAIIIVKNIPKLIGREASKQGINDTSYPVKCECAICMYMHTLANTQWDGFIIPNRLIRNVVSKKDTPVSVPLLLLQ